MHDVILRFNEHVHTCKSVAVGRLKHSTAINPLGAVEDWKYTRGWSANVARALNAYRRLNNMVNEYDWGISARGVR